MEKDLFDPIKEYFEGFGYVCDGEVNDIDLYMEKGEERVAVELKVTLDFKAFRQAALRQKITDHVFIGTFTPSNMNSREFKEKLYLLKRLGIGLIIVSKRSGRVEIVNEPVVSELSSFQIRNKGKKEALSAEFQRRKAKVNKGGVRHAKLVTGYREEALLILDALVSLGGFAKTKAIRELSGIEKTTSILYGNYYGWFVRQGTGVYGVSDAGYDALEEFEDALYALKRGNKK
ncbi:MAG: hypothetical protein K6A74_09105 [Lachnospiraceae bacterium]|nr:hypothetical protein [Lachnospiraceae bacterium]